MNRTRVQDAPRLLVLSLAALVVLVLAAGWYWMSASGPEMDRAAQIEAELVELSPEDRSGYLQSLGVEGSGVGDLIKSAYRLLGLMSFLTAGEKEVRAWTIPRGTRAPQAAGTIHSDIERGFIRAEIVSYDDLTRAGTYAAAREQGLLRLEGKEYVMQEGDIVNFRFNV